MGALPFQWLLNWQENSLTAAAPLLFPANASCSVCRETGHSGRSSRKECWSAILERHWRNCVALDRAAGASKYHRQRILSCVGVAACVAVGIDEFQISVLRLPEQRFVVIHCSIYAFDVHVFGLRGRNFKIQRARRT